MIVVSSDHHRELRVGKQANTAWGDFPENITLEARLSLAKCRKGRLNVGDTIHREQVDEQIQPQSHTGTQALRIRLRRSPG